MTQNKLLDPQACKAASVVIEELIAQGEDEVRTLKGWLRDEVDKDTKLLAAKEKSMEKLTPLERVFADNDPEKNFSPERLTLLDTIAEMENRIALQRRELLRMALLSRPEPPPVTGSKTSCLL